jgi:hypothetical protein
LSGCGSVLYTVTNRYTLGLIALAVVAVFAGGMGVLMYRDFRRFKARRSETTLEQRLSDLADLMRSSSMVLEEVQAEIQARVALAEEAKRSATDAQHVAQLNEAQRLAVARLVRAELNSEVAKSDRRAFWQSLAINFLFFAAGVAVTLLLAKH